MTFTHDVSHRNRMLYANSKLASKIKKNERAVVCKLYK